MLKLTTIQKCRLSGVIVSIALCFSMMGCSTAEESSTIGDVSENVNSTTSNDEDEEKASNEDTGQSKSDSSQSLAPFNFDSTIEETVLADSDVIKITATALSFRNNTAYIELVLENKTDQTLRASSDTSMNYINDYMIPVGSFSCELEPGATETDEMAFRTDEMRLYGITEIAEIGCGFSVRNDDFEEVYEGSSTIKTSSYDTYAFNPQGFEEGLSNPAMQADLGYTLNVFKTNQVFDGGGVAIVSEALVENKDGEHSLFLDVANNNDQDVQVLLKEIKVNGELVYEFLWTGDGIAADKHCVMSMCFEDMVDEDEETSFDFSNIKTVSFIVGVADFSNNMLIDPTEVTVEL